MAQCKLTPREFIGNTFSPQIAAVCSTAADNTCQKNNLSFTELLQPFCKLNSEAHIKDPQGNTIAIKNLRLSIQDVNAQPPEPTLARKMLNEAVSSTWCERTTSIRIGTTDLAIPISVPWFEGWRDMFLGVQFPSDHEFTKHFLACMIVISTAEDNPLEKIQHMGAQLHQNIPSKLPKWFNNNVLRYYILVHDTYQDDKNKAEMVFTEMKNIYGVNNCFLLQMNSRPPGQPEDNTHLPDPWSQFLVRSTEYLESNEQNSSPLTPADVGRVSSMPNEVNTESERSSQAGTPIVAHNSILMTLEAAETFSPATSEPIKVEVGQEAVPVTIHPLSPDTDKSFVPNINTKDKIIDTTPMNANVWSDSPTYVVPQHGVKLSTQDLERLRSLITEFCLKSLLPYVEKQMNLLHDVISNKKGVSRSLLSATKRWFGTNKPGVPGPGPLNAVIYAVESPELQLRRLGDLCFMFGHYSFAYQIYHSAKRDFAADQAWLYYAGALEMAALSAFMQGEMNKKTIEYMDDAILTYSTSCKMPQFATRATLLSAECLKGRGMYSDAAKQLIRMTSEDSDLRSALLLEQAAYCFINPKMIRKYAFHEVLAGHRFSKAGQRKHSLRCYQQAYQVYCGRGWSLAEDHIHFTMGRQATSLKQVSEAVKAFEKLLNPSSKQPSLQQAAFLREFLHTHNLLHEENTDNQQELPILPLPIIDSDDIKVLFGFLAKPDESNILASHITFDTDDFNDSKWFKMEEILITEVQGNPPMIFEPTISLYSKNSNNNCKPNAMLNEPVHFSIELDNPLHVPLPLSDVTLIWLFVDENRTFTNENSTDDSLVETQTIDSIVLQPNCKQNIVLSLTPKQVGELKVLGLIYKLSNPNQTMTDVPIVNSTVTIEGKKLFEIRGRKLKIVKSKPSAELYDADYRLEMNVVERAPFLKISLSKLSPEMLCGEIQKIEMTLENIGNAPLRNICFACTDPKLISLENQDPIKSFKKNSRFVTRVSLSEHKNKELQMGEKCKLLVWVQAPHVKGTHRLDLLFYYENVNSKSVTKFRLCRHTWHLTVLDSIQLSAIALRSGLFKNDSPTLNLILSVKNMNQVYDPFMNEILLNRVSFESKIWAIHKSQVIPSNIKMQPQEICHLMFKVQKKQIEQTNSSVCLGEESDDPIEKAPYVNFVEKRNLSALDKEETTISDFQQISNKNNNPFSMTMTLNSTMILAWQANVMENGVIARRAIGQHHLDIEFLNKMYKHPKDNLIDQNEYGGCLKIFGPDRNVPSSMSVVDKNAFSDVEFRRHVVSFSLKHIRHTGHNFEKNRLCFVQVVLYIQNHLQSEIDVKINTIGTSSQTQLPSIQSQLCVLQASNNFRYICHSGIRCRIEPFVRHTVKLQAVLSSPGTYDLAGRIEISVSLLGKDEFVLQKWTMESICIVDNNNS